MSVETGMFVANTSGATTTVATGFQYKAIILYCFGAGTTEAEQANMLYSLGISDGTNVWNNALASNDAVATTSCGEEASITVLLRLPTGLSGGVNQFASVSLNSVAFNSGNFVATFSGTPAAAYKIGYIGFGGADITNAKVFNAAFTAGTGTKTTSTVGFQGNIAFFFSVRAASNDSSVSNCDIGIGCAVDSGHQWCSSIDLVNGASTSGTVLARSYINNANCLVSMNPFTPVVANLQSFTAFTSNGFTTSASVAAASGRYAFLVLQGGTWDCGVSAKPTTAAVQTVTGESAQPNFVGLTLVGATANATLTSGIQLSFGGAGSTTSRSYAACFGNDAINTVAKSNCKSVKCCSERTGSSTWNEADFTSFNSDGWTITWNNTGSAFLVGWWASLQSGGGGTMLPIGTDYEWLGGEEQ